VWYSLKFIPKRSSRLKSAHTHAWYDEEPTVNSIPADTGVIPILHIQLSIGLAVRLLVVVKGHLLPSRLSTASFKIRLSINWVILVE